MLQLPALLVLLLQHLVEGDQLLPHLLQVQRVALHLPVSLRVPPDLLLRVGQLGPELAYQILQLGDRVDVLVVLPLEGAAPDLLGEELVLEQAHFSQLVDQLLLGRVQGVEGLAGALGRAKPVGGAELVVVGLHVG